MRPCWIPSMWSRVFWMPLMRRKGAGRIPSPSMSGGDRRHMQDADALSVRESVALPLNLEMTAARRLGETGGKHRSEEHV